MPAAWVQVGWGLVNPNPYPSPYAPVASTRGIPYNLAEPNSRFGSAQHKFAQTEPKVWFLVLHRRWNCECVQTCSNCTCCTLIIGLGGIDFPFTTELPLKCHCPGAEKMTQWYVSSAILLNWCITCIPLYYHQVHTCIMCSFCAHLHPTSREIFQLSICLHFLALC